MRVNSRTISLEISQDADGTVEYPRLSAGQCYRYNDGLSNQWCVAIGPVSFLTDVAGLCAFFATEDAARAAYDHAMLVSPGEK